MVVLLTDAVSVMSADRDFTCSTVANHSPIMSVLSLLAEAEGVMAGLACVSGRIRAGRKTGLPRTVLLPRRTLGGARPWL